MIFDTASSDIILISYPSGGFGNFIYHILTEFANETVKVDNSTFKFDDTGNSHQSTKYTEIYYKDPLVYTATISVESNNKKILVLCDNGINNDKYTKINKIFPNATIIRLVISDAVRPIIYQTCMMKAAEQNIIDATKNHILDHWNDADESYAIRENFTLLYHNWPFAWQQNDTTINVELEYLITNPINTIEALISNLGMTIANQQLLNRAVTDWIDANSIYFAVYTNANKIMQAIKDNISIDISNISDLHEQGYINFCIEQHYGIIIPVYDYCDWFRSTDQIQQAIRKINEKKFTNCQ